MKTLKILKMTYGARKGKKIFAQVLANGYDQFEFSDQNMFPSHAEYARSNPFNFYSVSGYFNFSKSPQSTEYWWKVVKAEALTRKRLGLEYSTSAHI